MAKEEDLMIDKGKTVSLDFRRSEAGSKSPSESLA